MAADLCLARETVWYDGKKYEQAEARYQEIVAARHAGLKIVVRARSLIRILNVRDGEGVVPLICLSVIPVQGKPVAVSGSSVSSKLQEAKDMIARTLQNAGESSGLEARVIKLERENREMKSGEAHWGWWWSHSNARKVALEWDLLSERERERDS